ncbi:roadblock/LC7 domain-containing protein [Streptomyces sp. NRRL F-5053]|uniref:roadblock/LC7 domain-containing protein n=1 Tax=Streptomyces sp. NRRL F-5053 TaxID=1463854 RepID=UPI0004C525BC|nr:roadblock/LC7 domain-containing protein [Streptomyces sp. NRRL F-5053]
MTNTDLSWKMTELRTNTPHARHALLVAQDGIALACDDALNHDDTDHLAALVSGMASLSDGVGQRFDCGARMRMNLVELDTCQLLIMKAGHGSHLSVLADLEADPGDIGSRMSQEVERLTDHLGVASRTTAP